MGNRFFNKGKLKDKKIVAALSQAAKDYDNGEIAEVRELLLEIVIAIDEWEKAEGIADTPGMVKYSQQYFMAIARQIKEECENHNFYYGEGVCKCVYSAVGETCPFEEGSGIPADWRV